MTRKVLFIKKDVDLKILEDFGFKYRPYPNKSIIYGINIPCFTADPNYLNVDVYVDENDRMVRGEIAFNSKDNHSDGIELAFPLIVKLAEAGLLEIGEQEEY